MQGAQQIFETERLVVRQYTEADAANFFSLSGNETVMRYIRPVSTREASDKFFTDCLAAYESNPHRGRWAVIEKQSGNFVGSFAIIPMPSAPEKIQLGYSLLPSQWGKGFATELTREALKYFFATDPLSAIHAITETGNIASQNVLLKAGFIAAGPFVEEGKELLMFVAKPSNRTRDAEK